MPEQNHEAGGSDLSCDWHSDLKSLFLCFFLLINVTCAYYVKLRIYGKIDFSSCSTLYHIMESSSKFDSTFKKIKMHLPSEDIRKEKM